ncbi:hypothetical protein HPB48_012833 [Haemaphysalis longicornis]|uniref:Uncharacterized protein n=1 Tax=Haemaphysalis longicornis TaxID=44386 RepID=A0A9J6GLG1_HAELO|nr:hypothetical protein HPB48_012833 [Haemaphysalis longicornis]
MTNSKGKELSSATITTENIDSAEDAAIALATTTITKSQAHTIVITDFQAACGNFQKGRISPVAPNILLKLKDQKGDYVLDIYVL